jgi:hypothetical protein
VPPEDLETVRVSLDRALALPMDAALRDSATRMREELGALREPDARRLQQAMMLLFRIVRAQRKP